MIPEEHLKLFPSRLFFCSDNLHSMHFILSLKHMENPQKDELVQLLDYCGAELSFAAEDATKYSAVIVDHGEVVNVKAPAFTINYFEDCLNTLKIQNISDYRQSATSHIAQDIDCMEVVYHRTKSWDLVLTEAEIHWFEGQARVSRAADNSIKNVSSRVRVLHPEAPQPQVRSPVNPRLSSDNDSDMDITETTDHQTRGNESCKRPQNNFKLSSDDDSDLEETRDHQTKNNKSCERPEQTNILSSDDDSDLEETTDYQIKDCKSCERLQKTNMLSSDDDSDLEETTEHQTQDNKSCERPQNTSLQELAEKPISDDSIPVDKTIHQTTNNKSCERPQNSKEKRAKNEDSGKRGTETPVNTPHKKTRNIKNNPTYNYDKKSGCSRTREGISNSSTTIKQKGDSAPSTSSKWSFLDEFQSENSSDEESQQPKELMAEKEKPEEEKNFFSFNAGNEDLFLAKDKKQWRKPYSREEQSNILRYIRDNDEYLRVKGRMLWQIMERKKICPNRTWQSMKEHFVKKIIFNLDSYDFLTKSEKLKFKQALS